MKNFNQCFKWLLIDEGGYTNDPADSGGATNLGITIKDYRMYINPNGTPADVKKLTVEQAKRIYKTKYWDALGCDKLPSGVDNACFNYGVLAGIGRPKANLKRFANIKDTDQLIDAMCDEMKGFLNRLATQRPKDERFRKGWNNRVDRLRKNSHYLAATKKDNISGPSSSGFSILTYFSIVHDYINSHPYLVAFGAIAVGAIVWYTVHKIRNKNA